MMYRQPAEWKPAIGGGQCYVLANLERTAIHFLLQNTYPIVSWASASTGMCLTAHPRPLCTQQLSTCPQSSPPTVPKPRRDGEKPTIWQVKDSPKQRRFFRVGGDRTLRLTRAMRVSDATNRHRYSSACPGSPGRR